MGAARVMMSRSSVSTSTVKRAQLTQWRIMEALEALRAEHHIPRHRVGRAERQRRVPALKHDVVHIFHEADWPMRRDRRAAGCADRALRANPPTSNRMG